MVPYNSIKEESSNFFARDLLLASTDSNASTKHSYEYETMEECVRINFDEMHVFTSDKKSTDSCT